MITTLLNQIGHDGNNDYCDFCGSDYSLDINKLYRDKERHFVGRDWFPLVGSMISDAQSLPICSRALNICSKCLYMVQYLPISAVLIGGYLALFQSTAMLFVYEMIKEIVDKNINRLGVGKVNSKNKLETEGKEDGSRGTVRRLLEIMKRSSRKDASLIMYQYTNSGTAGEDEVLKKQLIPNPTLDFLWTAAKEDLAKDIDDLTLWEIGERRPKYKNTFFSRITNREDYLRLYPYAWYNRKKHQEEWDNGASSGLFLLYQTRILGYSSKFLITAFNISEFIKSHDEYFGRLYINLERDIKKQNIVRKWIADMAKEGKITFDEYYNMFVYEQSDRRNRWWLVKYYLSKRLTEQEYKDVKEEFDEVKDEAQIVYNSEYRDKVAIIGNMIYDMIKEERGFEYMKKFLNKFATRVIGRYWLETQFRKLAEKNEDFDYKKDWEQLFGYAFGDERGMRQVYDFLYLLRLLFATRIYKETTQLEVDAIKS